MIQEAVLVPMQFYGEAAAPGMGQSDPINCNGAWIATYETGESLPGHAADRGDELSGNGDAVVIGRRSHWIPI